MAESVGPASIQLDSCYLSGPILTVLVLLSILLLQSMKAVAIDFDSCVIEQGIAAMFFSSLELT